MSKPEHNSSSKDKHNHDNAMSALALGNLVSRARNIYFIISALMVAVLLLIGSLMSRDIADDTARRMARQYSIEAASNFQVFMNSHMNLMRQLAHSVTVARWLANENDMEAKAAAFTEAMGYAIFSPDAYVMFTVYETMFPYNFSTNLTLDEFTAGSRHVEGEETEWFYKTMDADAPFILNIQRTRPDERGNWYLYIWSNHRVYYEGRFVGVVTVGSHFAKVFDAIFGSFDIDGKRGYIIDRFGAVRLDSAGILDVAADGIPVFPNVPEASENTALAYSISSHLQRLRDGTFPLGTSTYESIRLFSGAYHYASISPIIGTDWAILVLSGHSGFDHRYTPLVISAFILLILSVLIGSTLIHRLVLIPLQEGERRIEAAKREREANELAQMFLDASPMCIELIDAEKNYFYCNQQLLDISKVSSAEEYNRRFTELSPEYQPCGMPSMERVSAFMDKAFEEGRANFEWLHLTAKGEPLPMDVTFVRVYFHGKPILVSYSYDLRPIKAEMEKTREANELAQTFLDASPMCIELIDAEKNYFYCNQQLLDITEMPSAEEYNRRFTELSPEYQPCGMPSMEKASAFMDKAFEEGRANFEWLHLTTKGEPLPMDVTFVRIERHGEPTLVSYSYDLRPIKAAMEKTRNAEEENLAKTRFLARMSHEIRTPLTAITGVSEVQLRGQAMPPHTEEAFVKIYNSSKILLAIVNDILDFSKIESGNMPLVSNEYDVASLVCDAAKLYAVYSEGKDVSFQMHVDESLPAKLIGDALRIRQIISNVLTNAFKYTGSGTVVLSLRHESVKDGYVTLVFSIQDTGTGMSVEQLNNIKGLHSEYAAGGAGLGLPIVYNLIQMMDAKLNLQSEIGKGTHVTIHIPQKVSGAERLGAEMARRLQSFESGTWASEKLEFVPESMPHGKVLVVDDVEMNLYVAEAILESFDLTIELCGGGQEAIDKIRQGNVYDIIFMDHMMPGIDGIETTKILRDMGYKRPIVALTANAVEGHEIFMRNGFSGFMSKPIDINILSSYLTRFITQENL